MHASETALLFSASRNHLRHQPSTRAIRPPARAIRPPAREISPSTWTIHQSAQCPPAWTSRLRTCITRLRELHALSWRQRVLRFRLTGEDELKYMESYYYGVTVYLTLVELTYNLHVISQFVLFCLNIAFHFPLLSCIANRQCTHF